MSVISFTRHVHIQQSIFSFNFNAIKLDPTLRFIAAPSAAAAMTLAIAFKVDAPVSC